MRLRTPYMLAAACLLLLAASSAYGATVNTVNVDCSDPKAKVKSITEALTMISPAGPNIIQVSGTCNENVHIKGFDDLTISANTGASINDPTPSVPDDNDVIDIVNSRRVTVQGFTINQGFDSIRCAAFSICFLNDNIVQGAFDAEVLIDRGSMADLRNNTLQNGASGFTVQLGSQAHIFGGTIAGNSGPGLVATVQSLLALGGGVNVQNNGLTDGESGIDAAENSTVFLADATISGSGGSGVQVFDASLLRVFAGATITGNAGTGVAVGSSSFASIAGSANVSGNGASPQASCSGHFSVVRAQGANAALSCTNP